MKQIEKMSINELQDPGMFKLYAIDTLYCYGKPCKPLYPLIL